jgi:hypothetical protein
LRHILDSHELFSCFFFQIESLASLNMQFIFFHRQLRMARKADQGFLACVLVMVFAGKSRESTRRVIQGGFYYKVGCRKVESAETCGSLSSIQVFAHLDQDDKRVNSSRDQRYPWISPFWKGRTMSKARATLRQLCRVRTANTYPALLPPSF